MLKLEMGKKYKSTDEQIWEVVYIGDKDITYPVIATTYEDWILDPATFTLDGKFINGDFDDNDLVEEVK
jgi:hypothetical protein